MAWKAPTGCASGGAAHGAAWECCAWGRCMGHCQAGAAGPGMWREGSLRAQRCAGWRGGAMKRARGDDGDFDDWGLDSPSSASSAGSPSSPSSLVLELSSDQRQGDLDSSDGGPRASHGDEERSLVLPGARARASVLRVLALTTVCVADVLRRYPRRRPAGALLAMGRLVMRVTERLCW